MKQKKQGTLDLRVSKVLRIAPTVPGHKPDTSWQRHTKPSKEFSEGQIEELCAVIHDEEGHIPWRKRRAISPSENDVARGQAIRVLRWIRDCKDVLEFL